MLNGGLWVSTQKRSNFGWFGVPRTPIFRNLHYLHIQKLISNTYMYNNHIFERFCVASSASHVDPCFLCGTTSALWPELRLWDQWIITGSKTLVGDIPIILSLIYPQKMMDGSTSFSVSDINLPCKKESYVCWENPSPPVIFLAMLLRSVDELRHGLCTLSRKLFEVDPQSHEHQNTLVGAELFGCLDTGAS